MTTEYQIGHVFGPDEQGDYWQRHPEGFWATGKLAQNVWFAATPSEVETLLVPLLTAEIERLWAALEESCRDNRFELWPCPAVLKTERLQATLTRIAAGHEDADVIAKEALNDE